MRLDLLLTRLRLVKSRSTAQHLIARGHMRLNGQRVLHRDRRVAMGDILTLPLGREVHVIEILALPDRRGPATEAQACYRTVDAARTMPIAGGERRGPAPA